ncbi:MAG: site-2 protease family protein [Alkalinema sp. CACIAM 70d]|nr:MAG: site-2 protease family protein [Alkalinema sp. CACIAM 70d]
MITALTVLVALGILGWGFYRAKPYGKLGILSWLQSVTLMAPWLLFFGLFSVGVYLNLVGMLLLFVISTGGYILLGRQIRAIAPEELAKRAEEIAKARAAASETSSTSDQAADQDAEAATKTPFPAAAIPQLQPISTEDLTAIKGIFGIDTFFATETIPFQDGAVFNGNLRGDGEKVHAKLSELLQERLGDRYRLFLVENQEGRPTVVVLPSSNDPKPLNLTQKILAVILFVATIGTTLEMAGLLQGFDFYSAPQRYTEVVPLAAGLFTILTAHELGHWVMAKRHHVKLSWPFFFPTWQIGSFGALTNFESLLPNRSALFDIAFAGPAAGGLLSLGMLITGLTLSHPGSPFKVPTSFFEGSMLVGTLTRVILGSEVQQDFIEVSPLVVLGWLGLVITAINLMPAGRLDGGRIVQAIYGRKVATRTTVVTVVFLGLAALVNPLALYWAIVILFLQRNLERPSLNELPEPDDTRAALGLLALFLMITVLLPLTPSLAGRLGFSV